MNCMHGTGPLVRVKLAQYRVGRAPMRMMTNALGSCLGIVLYDEKAGIGAMAHVMHPNRDKVKNNGNRAKFVDTAIVLMLNSMVKRGASRELIVAKIFGGARMFGHIVGDRGVLQIGDENVAVARAELKNLCIPIVAESVGGNKGRTVLFDISDGSVLVKDAYDNEEVY
jgi:chemotaxis protein CheD